MKKTKQRRRKKKKEDEDDEAKEMPLMNFMKKKEKFVYTYTDDIDECAYMPLHIKLI